MAITDAQWISQCQTITGVRDQMTLTFINVIMEFGTLQYKAILF